MLRKVVAVVVVRHSLIILIGFLFTAPIVRAGELSFSVQSGMLSGDFAGADSGVIDMSNAFDLQAEYSTSSKTSVSARSTLSLNVDSGIFRYLYAGLGWRNYFRSHSGPQAFEYEANRIQMNPKVQYFVSGEAGFSQMVIRQVTDSFSIQATMIEVGGTVGLIYPLSNNLGLYSTMGYLKGIGISAVAVDSTIYKVFVGINFR